MKTRILNTLSLLILVGLGNVSLAQRADQAYKEANVELMIVKSEAGCDDCESYIYERIGDKTKRIAFLYPEDPVPNSKQNAYNAAMIQEILTEYSLEGYDILDTYFKKPQASSNKTIVYELGRNDATWVSVQR